MPFLIKPELIKSTQPPKEGWTKMKLIKVETVQNKKNSNYTDTQLVFECLQGPGNSDDNIGKIVSKWFYGAGLSLNIPQAAEEFLSCIQAFTGIIDRNSLIGQEIEFEKFVGKNVYGNISMRPYNGKDYYEVKQFQPETEPPF